jgi:ABC-type multidrug transport system ATPase subunit
MAEPHDAVTEVRPSGTPTVRQSAPASFHVGETINGRYRIDAEVGEGGYGRVFRAFDTMLGRPVALKTLVPARSHDSAQLIAEARTIAKLDHPHIVPIYDVGVVNDVPWMAMKLIDGEGLDRRIRQSGPLGREQALAIVAQTARALDHAHRRGIVHRDVKPSNILLGPHERGAEGGDHAWLADFGIARLLTELTSDAFVTGTPAYMAPEQISGKRVDARTDLFALACVAVEALTGIRCFRGASYTELLYKIVHDPPEGLAQAGNAAGPRVEALLRRALAKSPEDRVQTAEEFARLLLDDRPERRPPLLQRLRHRRSEGAWDGRHVVAAEGVVKGYGWSEPVVKGANLHVERGAIFALLGRNGAGKTTLLRTLIGLYRRDGGDVRIFGRDPERERDAILGRIGYVAESLPVYDDLAVIQVMSLMESMYATWDAGLAHTLLGRYRVPLTKKIKTLSRGMRTQIGLISALGHRPELLVLDDPTLGLDAVVLDDFFGTLEEISRKEGTTVLIASHNIAELEPIATHVAFFAEGRVVLSDSVATLRTRTRATQDPGTEGREPTLREIFVSVMREPDR